MKYQNITNLLGNTPNQSTKIRTKNWVETNDESRGTYNSIQFRFESSMLRSGLCNYTCECNYNYPKHRNSSKPKQ